MVRRGRPDGGDGLRATTVVPAVVAVASHLRVRGREIDLLHAEVAYPVAASVALAVRLSGWKGHLAITPTGEDVVVVAEAGYGFRRHQVPRRLVDWTLRQASCIRCLSPLLDAHVAPLAGSVPRRVVPRSVSWATVNRALESDAQLAEARRSARASVDERCGSHGRALIMAFGRLHPFKGLDVLVRATAAVPDAVLAIVGPSLSVRPFGDTAAALRRLAGTLGIAERVHMLGAVPPRDPAALAGRHRRHRARPMARRSRRGRRAGPWGAVFGSAQARGGAASAARRGSR